MQKPEKSEWSIVRFCKTNLQIYLQFAWNYNQVAYVCICIYLKEFRIKCKASANFSAIWKPRYTDIVSVRMHVYVLVSPIKQIWLNKFRSS